MQKTGRQKRAKTNGDAVEVDLTQDPDDDRGPEVLTISDDDDDDDVALNGVSPCSPTSVSISTVPTEVWEFRLWGIHCIDLTA